MEKYRSLQLFIHILLKCSPKGTENYSISIKDDFFRVHLYLFKEHVCFILFLYGHFAKHKNAHLIDFLTTTIR